MLIKTKFATTLIALLIVIAFAPKVYAQVPPPPLDHQLYCNDCHRSAR